MSSMDESEVSLSSTTGAVSWADAAAAGGGSTFSTRAPACVLRNSVHGMISFVTCIPFILSAVP